MALTTSQVAFYGADTTDYTSATAAAQALGISPKQVTGDFNTAATWVVDGSYMVIAVGAQAAMALFWNPCGWSTTAFSDPACKTPFSYYQYPYDGAIAANYFESAAGASALDSLELAIMLGNYALHGSFPAGMCCLPAITELTGTCSTSDCQGSQTNSCPTTS